jgi:hypothetical protein
MSRAADARRRSGRSVRAGGSNATACAATPLTTDKYLLVGQLLFGARPAGRKLTLLQGDGRSELNAHGESSANHRKVDCGIARTAGALPLLPGS